MSWGAEAAATVAQSAWEAEGWLVLEVADFRCAVPVRRVREVVRSTILEEAGAVPAGVCGTAVSQGRRVPVVDLRSCFGLPSTDTLGRRILVVRSSGRWVGLRVDRVPRMIVLHRSEIQRLPAEVITSHSGYFAGTVPEGDGWLVLLDVDRLLAGS
jgi:purine-binding chemotaxis protein CheW